MGTRSLIKQLQHSRFIPESDRKEREEVVEKLLPLMSQYKDDIQSVDLKSLNTVLTEELPKVTAEKDDSKSKFRLISKILKIIKKIGSAIDLLTGGLLERINDFLQRLKDRWFTVFRRIRSLFKILSKLVKWTISFLTNPYVLLVLGLALLGKVLLDVDEIANERPDPHLFLDNTPTVGTMDTLQLEEAISKLSYSDTAVVNGIDNTPTMEARENLEDLAVNVLNPIQQRFGKNNIRVTSGYRTQELNSLLPGASSTSQHVKGQAMDIQVVNGRVGEVFNYIKENLEYDQLILERNSAGAVWIHVSFNEGNNRRTVGFKDFMSYGGGDGTYHSYTQEVQQYVNRNIFGYTIPT